MMAKPRLWSWELSPFAGKARIALSVKEIEVELVEVHPVKRPSRLRELNPANRVPVLEIDGIGITQSTAICEWAEEAGPGRPIWPLDPVARARARGLLRWVDDELLVNFFLSMRKAAFGPDEALDHPNIVANLDAALAKRWKPLEAMLTATPGPWLTGGEEPLMPDLASLPLAVRLPAWKPDAVPDAATYPRVTEWLDALRALPVAAEVERKGTRADELGF